MFTTKPTLFKTIYMNKISGFAIFKTFKIKILPRHERLGI